MRLGVPARGIAGGLPPATREPGVHATDFVHGYLKELILDLVIPPDTMITETDVSAATGLSRTPIREALLRLHEERLVQLLPRRGALVPRISARQVRELYDVRLLLELHAAEVICTDRVPVGPALQPICDRQAERYAADAEPPELIRIDRSFHSGLIDAAGNTVMSLVNDSLGDHHQRTGVLSFNLDRGRCGVAIEQHRAITAALVDFDLDAARTAIEEHLVVGEREFERLLRD